MHTFTIDYRKRRVQDGHRPPKGQLVDVGFFATSLPRLTLRCRMLRGHRPVVDGTLPERFGSDVVQAYMWVCCSRCGVRGEPQGSLDPHVYRIGWRYPGPWGPRIGERSMCTVKEDLPLLYLPGPIQAKPTGGLGGQLVIGPSGLTSWGFQVKVGNGGSDHTLAASLSLGVLGRLHLHTERIGTGLVRLLNPDRGSSSNPSRMIGFEVGDGRISWQLWSKRDSRPSHPVSHAWHGLQHLFGREHEARTGCCRVTRRRDQEPFWQHGEISLRVRDKLWGPKLYSYTAVAETVRLVRLPEGDYLVHLTLKRTVRGRKRGWAGPKPQPWTVEWRSVGEGIPDRPDCGWKGPISGSGVEVAGQSVPAGTWAAEAAAAIALQITQMRTRHRWEPAGRVDVDNQPAGPAQNTEVTG